MKRINSTVGIKALSYYLPNNFKTLEELEKDKKLISKAKVLKSFGFNKVRIAKNETHVDLAKKAVKDLLKTNDIDPLEIDIVIFAGAMNHSFMVYEKNYEIKNSLIKNPMDLFKYPASKLQYELGISNASVIGLGQQGCSSLFSAIRVGRDILVSEDNVKNVLCVSSDVFPDNAIREVVYNVLSDGAGAVLLTKDSNVNKIIVISQITKGYYWDGDLRQNELIASYFPTARNIISDTLKKADLKIEDIDILIPHNVSMRSWDILLELIGFPKKRFYGQNIAKNGHSIGADNIINLKDAIDSKIIKKDDLVLMFNFGFGVNWSCIILEH